MTRSMRRWSVALGLLLVSQALAAQGTPQSVPPRAPRSTSRSGIPAPQTGAQTGAPAGAKLGTVAVEVVRGPLKIAGPNESAGSPPIRHALVQLEDSAGLRRLQVAYTDTLGRVTFRVAPGFYGVRVRSCPGVRTLPPRVPVHLRGQVLMRIGCATGPSPSGAPTSGAPPRRAPARPRAPWLP